MCLFGTRFPLPADVCAHRKPGRAVVLVVGGASEALLAAEGTYDLVRGTEGVRTDGGESCQAHTNGNLGHNLAGGGMLRR